MISEREKKKDGYCRHLTLQLPPQNFKYNKKLSILQTKTEYPSNYWRVNIRHPKWLRPEVFQIRICSHFEIFAFIFLLVQHPSSKNLKSKMPQ